MGLIDITERGKSHTPIESVFNASGDSLLVSDNRQVVTLLQIAQNRFNVIAANLRDSPTVICFVGRVQQPDQVLVVQREQKKLQVYALNGKLLEAI